MYFPISSFFSFLNDASSIPATQYHGVALSYHISLFISFFLFFIFIRVSFFPVHFHFLLLNLTCVPLRFRQLTDFLMKIDSGNPHTTPTPICSSLSVGRPLSSLSMRRQKQHNNNNHKTKPKTTTKIPNKPQNNNKKQPKKKTHKTKTKRYQNYNE